MRFQKKVMKDAIKVMLNTTLESGAMRGQSANKLILERAFASETGKITGKGPVSYASLGLTLATGAGLFWWYDNQKVQRMQQLASDPVVVGQAALGGPFELIESQTGKKFTEQNLKGEFALIYFGFTHCPDVCPEELEKIAEAIDLIDKKTERRIKPVFITVDPERDTAKHVQEYVKEFHPRLMGLTGSADKVNAAARAYRVYHTRAALEGGDKNDYLIDHSIITYLLDPEGNFVTFYGKNQCAEDIARSVVQRIEAWQQTH